MNKNSELIKTKLTENEASMSRILMNEKDLKKSLKEEQDIRTTTIKQYEKKVLDLRNDYDSKISLLEEEVEKSKKNIENFKIYNENNEQIIRELSMSFNLKSF